MTNDERRELNIRLAKKCGWEVSVDQPYGSFKDGWVLVSFEDHSVKRFDATRSVDDCRKVEDEVSVRAEVRPVFETSPITQLCFGVRHWVRCDTHGMKCADGDWHVAPTEPEARAAACDAAGEG